MFDHVTIRASDREASERFYRRVLATLEIGAPYSDEHLAEWNDFSLAQATDANPATHRLHIAFVAPSRGHVDEYWRAGTARVIPTTARPGRGRSTAATTTAPSSSIQMATAPKRSTTAACARTG